MFMRLKTQKVKFWKIMRLKRLLNVIFGKNLVFLTLQKPQIAFSEKFRNKVLIY